MSAVPAGAPFPGVLTSPGEPGRWPDLGDMASISQMLVDHVRTPAVTVAVVDRPLEDSYRNTLY